MNGTKQGILILFWLVLVKNVQLLEQCEMKHNHQEGLCKPFYECPAIKKFRERGIPVTWCSESTLCCPETTRFPGSRISEKKCEEYKKSVEITTFLAPLHINGEPVKIITPKCKVTTGGLIIDGENAEKGSYPHMALIGWSGTQNEYEWKCGGSLISDNFVLTAAHCTFFYSQTTKRVDPEFVMLGEHDISVSEGDELILGIEKIIKHPEHDSSKKINDIALLKLNTRVKFNDYIRPACLNTVHSVTNRDTLTATGWGIIDKRSFKTAKILQYVYLNLVDNDNCSAAWEKIILDSQLCTYDVGKDTCQGDSGGPLQVRTEANPCVHLIVGITSYGASICASKNKPGIYTRVNRYLDWIERNVWQ